LVGICDANIKDRGLTTCPKAVDGKVAADVWGRFGAVGSWYRHITTWKDKGFVGDCGR
jgi:hypothetical protein